MKNLFFSFILISAAAVNARAVTIDYQSKPYLVSVSEDKVVHLVVPFDLFKSQYHPMAFARRVGLKFDNHPAEGFLFTHLKFKLSERCKPWLREIKSIAGEEVMPPISVPLVSCREMKEKQDMEVWLSYQKDLDNQPRFDYQTVNTAVPFFRTSTVVIDRMVQVEKDGGLEFQRRRSPSLFSVELSFEGGSDFDPWYAAYIELN